MLQITHFKLAMLKAGIVLGPSYMAAYLTDKMVWVVPTLAASSFFAASIGTSDQQLRQRLDEDVESDVSDVDNTDDG